MASSLGMQTRLTRESPRATLIVRRARKLRRRLQSQYVESAGVIHLRATLTGTQFSNRQCKKSNAVGCERNWVSKRILIVDDSDPVRKAVREVLEQQDGWEVSGEAANGLDAIEKAQRLRPDLILLDLSMPVMNGLEAARELTRLLPRVPLLMFTNFDTQQLKQAALSAGAASVVSKNESTAVLVSKIHTLLEPAS